MTTVQPEFISLSSILSWKHPGVTGIVTHNDQLVAWPFPDAPTEEEIETWRDEYIAAAAWEGAGGV